MISITLEGQAKSTSHIYLYHCMFGRACGYMSAEGKRIKADYQRQAREQFKKRSTFAEGLKMTMIVYHGTRRKVDVDNYNKLVLDALTGIVYDDDSQIIELTTRKAYDKERPRVEIEIVGLSG